MLEHDEDDRYITQAVLDEINSKITIEFVTNANDLFAYLEKCNDKTLPSLILLNFHASPIHAPEITKKIRGDVRFKHLPVVIVSGSVNQNVLKESYDAGASSFIVKPSTDSQTTSKISTFIRYWFETVELL